MAELDERVSEYIDRALRDRRNFEAMREEGALDKASEMLWGLFCDYTNALAIVRLGEPIADHKPMVAFARGLAKDLQDAEMIQAVNDAEQMHANFYHAFVTDSSALQRPFETITHFAQVVDRLIREAPVGAVRPRSASKNGGAAGPSHGRTG